MELELEGTADPQPEQEAMQKAIEAGGNKSKFDIILHYAHRAGELLWFDHLPELDNTIFYSIASVTQVIEILFSHNPKTKADTRRDTMLSVLPGNRITNTNLLTTSLEYYEATGAMTVDLFNYLVQTECPGFDVMTADSLLKAFRLIYGPHAIDGTQHYLVPYFMRSSDELPLISGELDLMLNILFPGLTVPD